MDLKQTIAELERQAAQYTEAANALRALQNGGASSAPAAVAEAIAPVRRRGRQPKAQGAAGAKPAAKKAGKAQGQKRYVSPETRAKIAAAIKARHDQKRQARGN